MKKPIAIVALAVCAMSITSCAPAITKEQAKAEANNIKMHMEQNGDYVAGKKFSLTASQTTYTYKDNVEAKSSIYNKVDIDLDTNYARSYSKIEYKAGSESEVLETTALAFIKDSKLVAGSIIKENGEIVSNNIVETEIYAVKELQGKLNEIYSQVTSVFENAVDAIFGYVNSLATDEQLKLAGISFASKGAGSLIITEVINMEAGDQYAKSNTSITFENYLLKEMKSTMDQNTVAGKRKGDLLYTFNYDKVTLDYSLN